MLKRGLRTAAFLLVFLLVYFIADGVLSTKTEDGVGTLNKYYALPRDTVDVLFVGSSHIGMNLDPAQMMDEEGIAGYALWSGMQPVWNSYYFVKEALTKQTPKVIVAEVFLCGTDIEFSDEATALKSIQAMKFSMNKINAALTSFPTWQKAVEALWGMPYYHTRYGELTNDDISFLKPQDTSIQTMSHDMKRVIAQDMLDYENIAETHPLAAKQETYLRKLIDLCEANNIPLVLLISPFRATYDEAVRLNRVEEIGRETGTAVLNYLKLYRNEGIDPEKDFYDEGHMNIEGVKKFTHSLGKRLKSDFDLPDRRADDAHIWSGSRAGASTAESIYKLTEKFVGDGASLFIDTGVKLYDNIYGSWTLLTRLDTSSIDDDGIYMSCFNEEWEKGYFGFRIKKLESGQFEIKMGNNQDRTVSSQGDTIDIAVVKDGTKYTVYADGNIVAMNDEWPCPSYSGSLLIGCQELSAGGEKFRYSRVKVENLEIYDTVLSESAMLEWSPQELPEPELPLGMDVSEPVEVYTMPGAFDGVNGEAAYVDTRVELLKAAGTRFTLHAGITAGEKLDDSVFFSCFAEETDNYRGILVRQTSDTTLNIIVGNNMGIDVPVTPGEKMNITIVKDGSLYTVYVNGEKLLDAYDGAAPAYGGSLVLGAQRDAEGKIFRVSKTKVNSLTVLAGVADESAIRNWQFADAPRDVSPREIRRVYSMDEPFIGNGADACIDTGVKLYDEPAADWTLHTVVNPAQNGDEGVFLSCFSEEPDKYRGFMLRREGESVLKLYLGQLTICDVPILPDEASIDLVIVKAGESYTVYRSGAVIAEATLGCSAYEGNLLIGCQASATGELFRFSTASVSALEVWDGALGANALFAVEK